MRRRFLNNKESFNYRDYMTIEALVDGVTVIMPRNVEYNIGEGWVTIESGVYTPALSKGQYISFRGHLLSGKFGTIQINGSCSLRGNCMSLIGKSFLHSRVFTLLFDNCPIIEVESGFLPATTLVDSCYSNMFSGCTSLTVAPELPATTLAYSCYGNMFHGCKKLNYIKMLATDISANSCLSNWVRGVSSTGTFVKSKDATWDVRGISGIPEGWTVKTDDEYSGVNLISFTIKMNPFVPSMVNYPQQTYQAVEGMTWVEWCASEYNINGFTVVENEIGKRVVHNYDRYVNDGVSAINANDIIISDGIYYYE